MAPEDFAENIKKEIHNLEMDPENISSRGATKGEIKKDVQKKIESLERTKEAMRFYELYEEAKKKQNIFDYDDVLENLVKIVEESEEASADIKERYQYILIDEHQDSSGVQNQFLERVWKGEEKPNIFVVGDDRQLIYGFGGASLNYFENFKHTFGKAKMIVLEENYRSTQKILDASHDLLKSSIVDGKLKSNTKDNHNLRLVEASYPRDEIIACGLEIKEKIKDGMAPEEMAILVPKNKNVRSAMAILRDMGIQVASGDKLNFFDTAEAQAFLRVLKIISEPADGVAISESFFDKFSDISPLDAHKFVRENKMRDFSILNIPEEKNSLFEEDDAVKIWINKLKSWIQKSSNLDVYALVQMIGTEFLLNTAKNHEDLVTRVEVVRTLLHLALSQTEKYSKINLKEFLNFINRLESYGEHIPLAVFSADEGVKVLTLHGSKGLEFEYVWIAHLDEKSLSGGKHGGFTLPEILEEKVVKKDEEVLKRELYVAITRAKRFCTLSYSLKSYTGGDLELANIVANLGEHFEKQTAGETEKIILKNDPRIYTENKQIEKENTTLTDLTKLVAKDYEDRKVSVSLLNNFFECPWKWYFRNLLQLPEEKSDSLEFGTLVHDSIDQVLKMNKKPTEKELENIIGENKDKKEVLKILKHWVENRLNEIAENHETEKSISMNDNKFPHLTIYGKIDLIEMLSPDDARVTDFKTGNPRKSSEIQKTDDEGRMEGYMRQLAMYSYLLGENSKFKKNVVESVLEFVQAKTPAENFYKTQISKEHIDLLIKDITDYDNMLKSGTWTSRPCHFKSYGKATSVC